jgi:hypothetical protein
MLQQLQSYPRGFLGILIAPVDRIARFEPLLTLGRAQIASGQLLTVSGAKPVLEPFY